jgi:hypothetical protein
MNPRKEKIKRQDKGFIDKKKENKVLENFIDDEYLVLKRYKNITRQRRLARKIKEL